MIAAAPAGEELVTVIVALLLPPTGTEPKFRFAVLKANPELLDALGVVVPPPPQDALNSAASTAIAAADPLLQFILGVRIAPIFRQFARDL